VPAIFMTNGGGTTEAAKAAEYSRKFGVPIDPDQVVLAHTPIRLLADQYRDKIVLILGNDVCRDVARSYGFKHPVTSDDILSQFPDLWPFRELPPDYPRYTQHDFAKEPVSAIFSFHDSWDWGRDAQICMDLLLSEKGQLGTRHQCQPGEARVGAIPFYACNQDFLWSNAHPHARFAHGAFRRVLEYLWRELGAGDTGNSTEADRRAVPPLALIKYGKPERPAYVFADAALRAWAARLHLSGPPSPEAVVYAIGDNPHSDIAGANAWGWHGILVETGVYERGVSPETHGAQHVAADAGEAIDYIFARHGIHN
ncbi:HAD-superfamily subfamily IIA hydrolase, partial [Caulochytrium protostelioides]